MAKIYIGNPSCGAIETDLRRVSPLSFRGRRQHRHKSKSRKARQLVSRLSGAWLMDMQDIEPAVMQPPSHPGGRHRSEAQPLMKRRGKA